MSAVPAETTRARSAARLVPSLERNALFIVAIAVMSVVFLTRGYLHLNQDGWVALVSGREVANNGIPQHDTLTVWSAGDRWIDQQWLAQLVMYGLNEAGGLAAVVIVHLALVMTAFALAIVAAQALGARREHVVWILPVAGVPYLAIASEVRTQGFAFPLFVALLWLLASDPGATRRRTLLVLPALAVWANVHGSVVLGVALVTLYGLIRLVSAWRDRSALRRAFAFAIGAPVMLLLTPYHIDGLQYYANTVLNSNFRGVIAEWKPVTDDPFYAVPFFALAFTAAWVLGRARGRATAFDHLALLTLTVAGITAVRNVSWFALGIVVLLPPLISGVAREPRPADLRRGLNLGLAAASVAALVIAVVVVASKPQSWFEQRYDRRAAIVVAEEAARDPSLRIFVEGRMGDWLLWHEPQLAGRIAYDARLELLSDLQLRQLVYLAGATRRNWTAALEGFGLVVLDPRDQPRTADAFVKQPGVAEVYRGNDVIVAAAPRS